MIDIRKSFDLVFEFWPSFISFVCFRSYFVFFSHVLLSFPFIWLSVDWPFMCALPGGTLGMRSLPLRVESWLVSKERYISSFLISLPLFIYLLILPLNMSLAFFSFPFGFTPVITTSEINQSWLVVISHITFDFVSFFSVLYFGSYIPFDSSFRSYLLISPLPSLSLSR